MRDFNRLALEVAQLSKAKKRKVGAVVVGENPSCSVSAYNYHPECRPCELPDGTTDPMVVHAEVEAITQYNLTFSACKPYKIYVTQPPCAECQRAIQNAGIKEVIVVEEFMKFDSEKLRFELIPPKVEESLAKVLTYGARKYKPNNWRKGSIERYEAALLRHINAYRQGEACDKESGLLHLEHALCNVVFLLELHADKDKVK